MEVQNQVGRRLRADLARLHEVLNSAASQGVDSLARVADRVCDGFDLHDTRGRRQRASCRKALDALEGQGHISLPAPRRRSAGGCTPRVLAQRVAPAHAVPGEVGELRDVALVRVETDAQRLVWNTLMAHEHPRGAGPFVGHQLRYLVGSAHGWLGGVGFAACARRLNARDTWVGWDDAHRRAHLHRVVGLCRFLIRPGVRCHNLASHVLGRTVREVGEDFERRYGYRPWLLETFVDETAHSGTSLRAANWVRVGESCGRGRTLQRMRAEPTVLCLQDTTSLNFTGRAHTQGLGAMGSNQTGAVARGLHLHTTLAVTPDGVPLGVLRAGFDAPPPPDPDNKGPKAREDRKSFRGIEGLRDCAQAAQRLPETRVVCTMDREADFLDLFIERREHAPQVELLVRAKVNRVLGKDRAPGGDTASHHLFDAVRHSPARGTCTVEVARLSARVKASKQAPKTQRAARVAHTTLRYQPVALPCPGASPVERWVVHAREERPPPEAEALEWFVLTTLPVTNAAEAQPVLQWYALRWRIEDYFRILKSGCKVEELQHHRAERLERAIAIKMVVGWRIQLMVRLGREVPELPGELLFSDTELRVLATFARSRHLSSPARLGEAVELVARLGGWLGRPRDPPGAQLLWHGYTQLVAMTFAFELHDEYG